MYIYMYVDILREREREREREKEREKTTRVEDGRRKMRLGSDKGDGQEKRFRETTSRLDSRICDVRTYVQS